MTLNILPTTMRARHVETGKWEILRQSSDAIFWQPHLPHESYSVDTGDEPVWADIDDYDSFEAA